MLIWNKWLTIVNNTIEQGKTNEFYKELKVIFIGEEGIHQGLSYEVCVPDFLFCYTIL